VKVRPLEWLVVERDFKAGDVVKLKLPMEVQVKSYDSSRVGLSVVRGPLAFSLKIDESWKRRGGSREWPGWEVFPGTPWNYGFPLDSDKSFGSWRVVEKPIKPNAQVFAPENAPVIIQAKALQVPGWKLEKNGMVQEIGTRPLGSGMALEEVTLVPMGCARLRITVFPGVGL